MIVYLITNMLDGKYYVGKTTLSMQERWEMHLINMRRIDKHEHLYRAMRKYGSENFKMELLAEAHDDEQLANLERLWIIALDSFGKQGYNMTYGGEGVRGTPEVRKKISEKALASWAAGRKFSAARLKQFGEMIRLPKLQSHRSAIAATWNDPGRRETQAAIARRVNQKENSKLKDYTCPTCDQEFKQVFRGVYGGHRKACLAKLSLKERTAIG